MLLRKLALKTLGSAQWDALACAHDCMSKAAALGFSRCVYKNPTEAMVSVIPIMKSAGELRVLNFWPEKLVFDWSNPNKHESDERDVFTPTDAFYMLSSINGVMHFHNTVNGALRGGRSAFEYNADRLTYDARRVISAQFSPEEMKIEGPDARGLLKIVIFH